MSQRRDFLEYKYVMSKASIDEMIELFELMGLSEQEINFRILLEENKVDLNDPLEIVN